MPFGRGNHLREKQFSAGLNLNPSRLHVARAGMRNEHLWKNIQSASTLNNERLRDLCLADGISCAENPGGAWTRQHGARPLTNSGADLDAITVEETRRRIDHVHDQVIPIPMRFAKMDWRTKRLFGEKRSARGVHSALNAQMTPDSAIRIRNGRH